MEKYLKFQRSYHGSDETPTMEQEFEMPKADHTEVVVAAVGRICHPQLKNQRPRVNGKECYAETYDIC